MTKVDNVTLTVARYFKEKGILVSTASEKTGISANVLYSSVCEKPTRKLRADEFMKICVFLDVDPHRFWCTARDLNLTGA